MRRVALLSMDVQMLNLSFVFKWQTMNHGLAFMLIRHDFFFISVYVREFEE